MLCRMFSILPINLQLETQLILLLAVTTAATAAAAASELLHRSNSAIISDRQLTDIDHGVGHHDLHRRSPAKFKGLGFFEGFAVAKKGFAKASDVCDSPKRGLESYTTLIPGWERPGRFRPRQEGRKGGDGAVHG